jgi:hypothetical protein
LQSKRAGLLALGDEQRFVGQRGGRHVALIGEGFEDLLFGRVGEARLVGLDVCDGEDPGN